MEENIVFRLYPLLMVALAPISAFVAVKLFTAFL